MESVYIKILGFDNGVIMELLLLELFRITPDTFYMEIGSHYAYEFACMNEYFKCFLFYIFCINVTLPYFLSSKCVAR